MVLRDDGPDEDRPQPGDGSLDLEAGPADAPPFDRAPDLDGPAPPDVLTPDGLFVVTVGNNSDNSVQVVPEDTLIDEGLPDRVFPTNPTCDARATIVPDTDMPSYRRKKCLIRFDLSILAGVRVQQAKLVVSVVTELNRVRFHEMLVPWSGESTWNRAGVDPGTLADVPWPLTGCENPGAAEAACYREPEFVVLDFPTRNVVATIPLPAELVQRWIDDPASNLGVMARVSEEEGYRFNEFEFASSEAGNLRRPYLELTLEL
jgi:hypothetical protein